MSGILRVKAFTLVTQGDILLGMAVNTFKAGTASFYDYGPLLSRNAAYNVVIGPRGDGKTFGAKWRAMKNAVEKNEQFILLRRFKTELHARNSFFDDIHRLFLKRYPGYQFRVHGLEAQILRPKDDPFAPQPEVDSKRKVAKELWQTIGFFVALSNSQQKKSVAYPSVTTLIFDEFIIDKGALHYLPNEVKAFNDFYTTVDRYQDRVKAFLISNTVSIMNPYFIEWDIRPEPGVEWIMKYKGFVCVHLIRDNAFAREVNETRMGQFISGTEYADYAVEGVFLDNHMEMVEQKTPNARYYATIETPTGIFSWWIDHETGKYYVQDKRPKVEQIWTMVPEKMTAEKYLMLSNDPSLQRLRTSFSRGRLFFSSAQARNSFVGVMKR